MPLRSWRGYQTFPNSSVPCNLTAGNLASLGPRATPSDSRTGTVRISFATKSPDPIRKGRQREDVRSRFLVGNFGASGTASLIEEQQIFPASSLSDLPSMV